MRTALKLLASTAMVTLGLTVPVAASASSPAPTEATRAASCDRWDRTLQKGASGEDVRQLQIRVSGYASSGTVLALDGKFGPATKKAVEGFQQAYELTADGVADDATLAKIQDLQDDDCSPVNFDFTELNQCNDDWSGGAVSASQAKENGLVSMWKLQALRHALGDRPITISSGFRSEACNSAVGGAENSRHLYGDAVDLTGTPSFCDLAQEGRNRGFAEILGRATPGTTTTPTWRIGRAATGTPPTAASEPPPPRWDLRFGGDTPMRRAQT